MKMKTTLFKIALILVCITSQLYAQKGDKFFEKKDYRSAIFSYENEVKTKPEKYFNLGKSHFGLKDFDKAIAAFEAYIEKYPKADKATAQKWIDLLKRDDDYIKINNLGNVVNTPVSEYFPRISADGKTLNFISKNRPGGFGGEDAWSATKKADGTWENIKNQTQFNTGSNEGVLSLSPDGNVAVLFGNYPGTFGGGDLFYSVKTDKGWTTPCNMGGAVNTSHWETQANIGFDGKTLIFASNRPGGKGATDLYFTQLTENGWTPAQNLGATINTAGDELYPYLSADNKTLFFVSTGHFGFGGRDLFMSKRTGDGWDAWSEPVNLGRYINTLGDDQDISIPSAGNKAYMVRKNQLDGQGEYDIYEFLVPFVFRPEESFTVFGRVNNEKDSSVAAVIRFYDMATGLEQTKTQSNSDDGKYYVSLPKYKKYKIEINMKGFLYYATTLDLTDPSAYRKKTNIYEKLAVKQEEIDDARLEVDRLHKELQTQLDSKSEAIKESFEKLEKLTKQLKAKTNELEDLIYEAKFAWMSEEEGALEVERNFQLQTATIGTTFELKNIFFDSGKATLREESKSELNKLYDILSMSEIVIELGGYTDSIGSPQSNLKLSQDRVNSVKQYLESKGISEKRLVAVGYGMERPIASNATEAGRQLNRRVEVKILRLSVQREGTETASDSIVERDEPIKVEKFDMKELLNQAARKGGLPSGSDCAIDENVVQYKVVPSKNKKPKKAKKAKKQRTPKEGKAPKNGKTRTTSGGGTGGSGGTGGTGGSGGSGGSWFGNGDDMDIDDNIYKNFTVGVRNFKYNSYGTSLGANIIITNSKLNEFHMEGYFVNPDSARFGAAMGYLWNIQFSELLNIPLMFQYGIDANLFAKGDRSLFHSTVPLGFRYMINSQKLDMIIAPELFYNAGILRTKNYLNNVTHIRAGLGVRWKFIHTGLYLNIGEEIRYTGFRAGFTF
jgi:OmpA-OmpF porin, OOP family